MRTSAPSGAGVRRTIRASLFQTHPAIADFDNGLHPRVTQHSGERPD